MKLQRAIDQLLDRWMERTPEARTAMRFDAKYHAQFSFIRRTYITLDMVMEDEGIPEDVRLRVIRTLIYGAPDPADALARMDEMAEHARKMATETRPLVVPEDLLRGSQVDPMARADAQQRRGAW